MTSNTQRQRGSALVYILIAVALLAALTATFMDSSSQQTTSQNTFNSVNELAAQVSFINSSIQECILTHPSGDTRPEVAAAPVPKPEMPYPLNPDSTLMLDPAPSGNREVKNIRCPGNPGNTNDHADIFGGSSGKFLPPPPKLFESWKYYNNVTDGVFIYISTNKTDAFLLTALEKLDEQYSKCQSDVINNANGSAAVSLSSQAGSGPVCPANSVCFRVWMKAHAGAVYPNETGCP